MIGGEQKGKDGQTWTAVLYRNRNLNDVVVEKWSSALRSLYIDSVESM